MKPEALPEILPIFPLPRVLLLPRAQLPLNIFEPRYLAMTNDALKSDRLIGMIQPRFGPEEDNGDPNALYQTGCAGRITSFAEMDNGRCLITLTGVCRFRISKELSKAPGGYRRIVPDWADFSRDLTPQNEGDFARDRMIPCLKSYLEKNKMTCDKWEEIRTLPAEKLVSCLAMICPFDAREKQALLEAADTAERAQKLCALLEINVLENCAEKAFH